MNRRERIIAISFLLLAIIFLAAFPGILERFSRRESARISQTVNYRDSVNKRFDYIQELVDGEFYQEALEECRDILRKYPDDPRGYAWLGYFYQHEGKHKEAIEYFEYALSMNPNDAFSHIHLVSSYI